MEILEKMRCGKVKIVKNFVVIRIPLGKGKLHGLFWIENLCFYVSKNKKDKIVVEKQKIFQQLKKTDSNKVFQFSTVFSTSCGKLEV